MLSEPCFFVRFSTTDRWPGNNSDWNLLDYSTCDEWARSIRCDRVTSKTFLVDQLKRADYLIVLKVVCHMYSIKDFSTLNNNQDILYGAPIIIYMNMFGDDICDITLQSEKPYKIQKIESSDKKLRDMWIFLNSFRKRPRLLFLHFIS